MGFKSKIGSKEPKIDTILKETPSMHSLIFDTSTERGVVSIFQGCNLCYQSNLPFGLQNSQFLLSELLKALDSTQLTIRMMDFIAVGVGPGSYTGIRVGAIAAKTLSFACRIPLIGICTLEAFVSDGEEEYAAIIDAKIAGVYFQIGGRGKKEIAYRKEPMLCPLEEAMEYLKDIPELVTPASKLLRQKFEVIAPDNPWIWSESPPSPKAMYEKALEKFRYGQFSLDGELELLYMRKTQAEIEGEKKFLS